MKRVIRSSIASVVGASILGLVALVAPAKAQDAAGLKPVVVVSFSGYDELRADLDFIGQLSDNPELAKSMDGLVAMFTQFQGLAGLDKAKPWGASVSTDGSAFQQIVFLPVTDLKKLLGALGHIVGQAQDVGGGVMKLENNNTTVFIKQVGNWAFVAQSPDQLATTPADPMKILGSLPSEYDVAVQANVQNIPPPLRQLAIDQMKLGMQSGLKRQDGESDAQYEMRTKLMQQQMEQLSKAINELEQLTLGYATDSKGRRAYFDVNVTATAGSSLAKQIATSTASSTKFAGFMDDDAVFQAQMSSKLDPTEIDNAVLMLKTLRGTLKDSIASDEDLKDPEEKKAVAALANEAIDVLEKTVKAGIVDAGISLVGEGPFTLAAGFAVEGGDQLESIVQKLFKMAKKKPDDVEVTWNAAQHRGITFHTITADWPQDEDADEEDIEGLQDFFGEEMTLTFGFGKDRVYFALGEDGIDELKDIIDDSATNVPPRAPLQMILALAPLLDFASGQDEDNAILAAVAESLDDSGKDKIRLIAKTLANGMQYRFEVEEGVLKAIGQSAKAAQGGGR